MFNRKQDYPSPKPDPPLSTSHLLVILLIVCSIGFSLSVSKLNAINAYLRHEETNQGYTVPQVPITTTFP